MIGSGFSDLDCLITDIGMPVVSGFDLRDAAKKVRPDLPVFLISGRHEIGDQQRVLASDIAGFFRKPFDGQALLAAVETSLKP
jgi:FixJ family two-component response regulator